MATWQADFHVLVPDALPSDYRERLAELLPAGKSWSNEMEIWGTYDADSLEVSHEPGAAPEVFVRFDLRRWNPELYARFVAFVRDIGGELRTAKGTVVALGTADLEGALRSSDAARFVADPHGVLARLSHTAWSARPPGRLYLW